MTSDELIPDRTLEIGGEGEPEPEPPPRLIVVVGASQGARLELSATDAEVVVGRNEECDLVLASPVVSARHARVSRNGADFSIEDLDSTNGVCVNGTDLEPGERRPLQHGDAIQLSDHMLLFVSRRSSADRTNFPTIEVDGVKAANEAEALLREFESLRMHRPD